MPTRNQTALLTVEIKFYPPPNPLALPSQPPDPPHTLLTHRNSIDTPLLQLLQHHINERKEGTVPPWVRALVCPDPTDPAAFTPPQCVMPASVDPLATATFSSGPGARPKPKRRPYYRFDATQSLAVLLRHTHFVEFPTIEVWEEFRGTVVDNSGAVTQAAQDDERAPKRRRLDRRAGGKAIAGLLDGYGSSDEEEEKEKVQNGLEMLGGYSGSEDDGEGVQGEVDSDEDEEVELDPAALLQLMRKARGDENWTPHTGDDDLVDWGDSDEDVV
jgi:hypothetical protein